MSDELWIVVPDWRDHQHGNRDNPWIRTYKRLLHMDKYIDLTLTQKGALHLVWLEFAAADGQLSVSRVSARGPLSVSRNLLESLNDAGWITFSASKPPRCSATTEKIREDKRTPLPPFRTPSPKPEPLIQDTGTKPFIQGTNLNGTGQVDIAAAVNRTGCTHKGCRDLEECYYE